MGQLTAPDSAKKARRGGGQAPAINPADTGPLPTSQSDRQSSGLFLPAPPPGFIPPAGGMPHPAAPPAFAGRAAGVKAEPVLQQHAGSDRRSKSQPVPAHNGISTQSQHTRAAEAASSGQRAVQGPAQGYAPSAAQPSVPPHRSVSPAHQDAQPGHCGSFMAGLRADLGSSMPLCERPPLPRQLPASLAAFPAYRKPAAADLPAYCGPAVRQQTQQQHTMQLSQPAQLPGNRHCSMGALPAGAVVMLEVSEAPHNAVPHRQVVASQQQYEAQHVEFVPTTQQEAAAQPQQGQPASNVMSNGAPTVSGQPHRTAVWLPGSHAQVAAIRDAGGLVPTFQESSIHDWRRWAHMCKAGERTQEG